MKLLLLLLQNTVKSTSHLRVKNVIRNKNIHLYNFLLVLIVRYTKYLEIYFFIANTLTILKSTTNILRSTYYYTYIHVILFL